jgi:hypothetical protein
MQRGTSGLALRRTPLEGLDAALWNSLQRAAGHNRVDKKKGRRIEARRPFVILRSGLEGLDVRGLQALRSFGDLEFNRLAVIQRLIAISHNRGEMHEHIFSTLALDETEALAGVKPLHCSLFFTHCFTLFCQPGYG